MAALNLSLKYHHAALSNVRPTDYTPELADQICAELASGISLRTVCNADDKPCTATVFNWLRRYPEFLHQYEKAKEESADALVEEMLDIADDGTNDWMEVNDKGGGCVGYKINGEHVQRSRLRVDVRKWAASKLKPKKYGDKLTHEGGDKPIRIQSIERHVIDPNSTDTDSTGISSPSGS